jgi:hypothetical protein
MSARPSAERCWWSPRLPPATRPPLTGLKLPLRGGNYGCLVTTHDPPIITASVLTARIAEVRTRHSGQGTVLVQQLPETSRLNSLTLGVSCRVS